MAANGDPVPYPRLGDFNRIDANIVHFYPITGLFCFGYPVDDAMPGQGRYVYP